MIAAAMIGRILKRMATMVVMKMVKRCHVVTFIARGGGINHTRVAKSAKTPAETYRLISTNSPFIR
jgi:hypothetical protein